MEKLYYTVAWLINLCGVVLLVYLKALTLDTLLIVLAITALALQITSYHKE